MVGYSISPIIFGKICKLKLTLMEQNGMPVVKFFNGKKIPVELHKVRVVQKIHLKQVDERYRATLISARGEGMRVSVNIYYNENDIEVLIAGIKT